MIIEKTGNVLQTLTLRRSHSTVVAVEKAIRITYSEYISVALSIQHAKRMRDFFFNCGLPRSTTVLPCYFIKGTIFGGEKLLNTKCVLILSSTLSEIFFILRRIQLDMMKIHVKYPLLLPDVHET